MSDLDDATLEILRNIDRSLDDGEGTTVEISNNGGTTWSQAFDWTVNSGQDDRMWHQESLTLNSSYLTSNFKIRVIGVSSSFSEENIIDNVKVTSNSAGPPPVITPAQITDLSYSLNQNNTGATLTWNAPSNNGHSISGYKLEQILSGSDVWSVLTESNNPDQNSYTIDVAEGLEYSFRVSAKNANGFGLHSNVVNFIIPDITPPTLVLKGEKVIVIEYDTAFADPGWSINDNVDGTLDDDVIVTGTVNQRALGTYQLLYRVSDSAGHITTAQRTVHVVDTTPPVFVDVSDYTVSGNNLVFPIYYAKPTATDGVDDDVSIHCSPSDIYKTEQTTIYCAATDSSGNSAETSFRITVPASVIFTLEPITTQSCSIRVQLGSTNTFSLEQCDSNYAGVTYNSIPRSMYYGSVAISTDRTTLLITAPDNIESHQRNDEFGVTIDSTYDRPRVDVAVIYYE